MVVDSVDVYWVRIPLAFVWRTSYADQHHTDTILMKMESQGLHAWGESCPPYIPAYSSEHTAATFHPLREHRAARIVGQDIRTAQDLLDRIAFVKGNHRHAGERAIGGAICAELATVPNFTYPGDIFPSSYFYRSDIGKPEIVLSGPGEIATAHVPGILEGDLDLLRQWTVAHAGFRR